VKTSLILSHETTATKSCVARPIHSDGFPATLRWTQPRVRFSVGENRMKSANATKVNRKSGEAEGSAVRLSM
jgi:hypothetical protein